MNITKGPMLERFARMIGAEIEEVLEWVNNYVNKPGLLEIQEPTEAERLDSVKCYILWSIENSTTEIIKRNKLKAAA